MSDDKLAEFISDLRSDSSENVVVRRIQLLELIEEILQVQSNMAIRKSTCAEQAKEIEKAEQEIFQLEDDKAKLCAELAELKARLAIAKAELTVDQARLLEAEKVAADERVKGVEYAMGFMNDKGSCSVGSITALKQYIARLKAGKGEG